MPKRILLIPELSGSVPNACAYIRLIHPLATLQKNLDLAVIDLSTIYLSGSTKLDFDLSGIGAISTQRTAPVQNAWIWGLLLRAKERGIPIHWDLDDLPLLLKHTSHESNYLALLADTTIKMKAVADVVTVSTQVIYEKLAPLFSSVRLHRNAIAQGLWASSAKSKSDSILYFGLEAHKSGLETISEKLHKRNLKKLEKMRFRIDAIGPFGNKYHPLIQVTPVPNFATTYPRFASWLSRSNQSSIGLIYHHITSLNSGKSAIKALEYSLLGLATLSNFNQAVTSDPIGEHISIVSDDDYIDELIRLFQDKVTQEKQSRLANDYVVKSRLLQNDASSMTTFFADFIDSIY